MSETKTSTLLLGDIHGNFMDISYMLNKYEIKDANIIQVGDFGMGFNKPGYYSDIFRKLNKRLITKNNHLYAFRGNHDDPEYFKETNNPFGYSNITLLKDYSTLELLGKKFLCIGGATSIDRTWGKRIQGKSWWSDEGVNLKSFEYDKFDWVLTHTRPLVASPSGVATKRIEEWIEKDEHLYEDLIKEGQLMNNIWDFTKPKNWAYGHFHESEIYDFGGTTFRCLGINELYTIYE